eukprot:TRINITY_DN827_c0_g1_i3.p2 TRINITY_DN827_c0_g1~~TRINITY_DN827_c0_g1_i3.p2  ORF type:complete len:424 (-),score=94.27 TRINITY_DN827_c0_g1_i3:2221-3492(-)
MVWKVEEEVKRREALIEKRELKKETKKARRKKSAVPDVLDTKKTAKAKKKGGRTPRGKKTPKSARRGDDSPAPEKPSQPKPKLKNKSTYGSEIKPAGGQRRWFVKYQTLRSDELQPTAKAKKKLSADDSILNKRVSGDFSVTPSFADDSSLSKNRDGRAGTSFTRSGHVVRKRKWTTRKNHLTNLNDIGESYRGSAEAEPDKKDDKIEVSVEGQRGKVLQELINTEQDYVKDLEHIIEMYIKPLRQKKLISPEAMREVFSNVESILGVNKELLRNFIAGNNTNGAQVGDSFLQMADFLKMYSVYCSNQNAAMTAVVDETQNNRDFAVFLAYTQAKPESRSLDLNSFLIKPVQRVCKYPLLLRELIKHTPKDHPDYEKLLQAYDKMEQSVSSINERKKELENLQKMFEIQAKVSGVLAHNFPGY